MLIQMKLYLGVANIPSLKAVPMLERKQDGGMIEGVFKAKQSEKRNKVNGGSIVWMCSIFTLSSESEKHFRSTQTIGTVCSSKIMPS